MSADSYTRMDDAAGHVCDPTTSPQSDFAIIEPIRWSQLTMKGIALPLFKSHTS